MTKKSKLTEEIEIPQDITIGIQGNLIILKGANGELSLQIKDPKVKFQLKERKLIFETENKKREWMQIRTYKAKINTMIKGITKKYIYKLKVCSGHFPMSLSIDKNELVIKNFFGEKVPRKAIILPNVKVEIKGDTILVEGISKEVTGQTAANIEKATQITNRCKKVFQDGIYIETKPGEKEI